MRICSKSFRSCRSSNGIAFGERGALLSGFSPHTRSGELETTAWCTTRSMAAAVVIGSLKILSHFENTRLEVIITLLRS